MSCGEGEWCAYSNAPYSSNRSSFQRPTAEAAGDTETFEDILLRLRPVIAMACPIVKGLDIKWTRMSVESRQEMTQIRRRFKKLCSLEIGTMTVMSRGDSHGSPLLVRA